MMLMMGRAVDLCILLAFVMLPSHVLGQAAVGEGEKCNPSLPPAHALLCTQGLYCSTSRPGAFGACMKCTPEKCRRPLLGNTTIVVANGGAGAACNPTLQNHAIFCNDGFYCNTMMPGSIGTCTKCTPERCERPQRSAGTIVTAAIPGEVHAEDKSGAKEGATCNPSLGSTHSIFCKSGLYCSTSRPGAFGTCMKCTPEKCRRPLLGNTTIVVAHEGAGWEHLSSLLSGAMGASTTEGEAGEAHPQQSFATEGEECKPSLPPPHAIICNDGLFCSAALPGAAGICRKCTPESCERPQTGAIAVEEIAIPGEVHPERPNTDGTQRTTVSGTPGAVHPELAIVGEGERCNPTLPPADAILCRDKLYCETAPGKRGGFGTCAKCLPGHCEPPRPILASIGQDSHAGDVHVERAVVGEGETCNPSLPPAFAISCSEGLHCAAKVLRGGYGTCRKCASNGCTESP